MSTKSSKLAINGKQVTVKSNLENGSFTVKDSQGRLIGSGTAAGGGSVVFSEGSRSAQAALLGIRGSAAIDTPFNRKALTKALNEKVRGVVENENQAILNKNATPEQLSILKNGGYGNKINIKNETVPVAPDNDTTPAPPTGNGEETGGDDTQTEEKPPEVQDLDGSMARYPTGQIDGQYDHVLFTIVEYVPGGKGGFGALIEGDGLAGRPTSRIKRENPVGSVILPIPRNVSDQNQTDFSSSEMNAFQAAGADLAMGFLGEGDGLGSAVDRVVAAAEADATGVKSVIKAKITESILGGGNILTRTTGAVLNSNLELLFKGPSLRTFQFQYIMTPRDKSEALECKKIVRMFKKAMAPKLKGGALFLYTPNIFFIDFKYKSQDHPFLNRIKPCALTSFGVNYTPDGAYATYADGSPVAYNLQFSFSEIEPIYDKDYESGEGAKGMGF